MLVNKKIKTVSEGRAISIGEISYRIQESPGLTVSSETVNAGREITNIEISRLGDGEIRIESTDEGILIIQNGITTKSSDVNHCEIILTGTSVSIRQIRSTELSMGTIRIITESTEDYLSESKEIEIIYSEWIQEIPTVVLRAWKSDNYYLSSADVPYYSSYSSEIPELETSSIRIYDARYLGRYLGINNDGSYKYAGVYIMIETNSDGAVSINQEASYAGFSSEGNGKYLVSIENSTGSSGSTDTDLIITVGETDTYEELSKTLSITFVHGSGSQEPSIKPP